MTHISSRKATTGMLTAIAAAIALAGCGGSSSGQHSSTAAGAAAASGAVVAQVQPSSGASSTTRHSGKGHGQPATGAGASAASGAAGATNAQGKTSGKQRLRAIDIVTTGSTVHRAKGGADEPVTPPITAPNPCRLVSQSQAQSILGGSVAESEAPLGPTCIMKVAQRKQVVTMAVETLSVKNQVRQMHQLEQETIGGHAAYCGRLGQPQLYLSLSGGKALSVSAPCAVARALAATALSHLQA